MKSRDRSSYYQPRERGYENPQDYHSSNQRTLRSKGFPEQFIYSDGRRYELFEICGVNRLNPDERPSERLATMQRRYPSRELIMELPSDLTAYKMPDCLCLIYIQADTPIVFGWDWSSAESGFLGARR